MIYKFRAIDKSTNETIDFEIADLFMDKRGNIYIKGKEGAKDIYVQKNGGKEINQDYKFYQNTGIKDPKGNDIFKRVGD